MPSSDASRFLFDWQHNFCLQSSSFTMDLIFRSSMYKVLPSKTSGDSKKKYYRTPKVTVRACAFTCRTTPSYLALKHNFEWDCWWFVQTAREKVVLLVFNDEHAPRGFPVLIIIITLWSQNLENSWVWRRKASRWKSQPSEEFEEFCPLWKTDRGGSSLLFGNREQSLALATFVFVGVQGKPSLQTGSS